VGCAGDDSVLLSGSTIGLEDGREVGIDCGLSVGSEKGLEDGLKVGDD